MNDEITEWGLRWNPAKAVRWKLSPFFSLSLLLILPITSSNESIFLLHSKRPGTCHGIAIWMDFQIDSNTTITTGLEKEVSGLSDSLDWCRSWKQGVHFLKHNPVVKDEAVQKLTYKASFKPESGNIFFQFQVVDRWTSCLGVNGWENSSKKTSFPAEMMVERDRRHVCNLLDWSSSDV